MSLNKNNYFRFSLTVVIFLALMSGITFTQNKLIDINKIVITNDLQGKDTIVNTSDINDLQIISLYPKTDDLNIDSLFAGNLLNFQMLTLDCENISNIEKYFSFFKKNDHFGHLTITNYKSNNLPNNIGDLTNLRILEIRNSKIMYFPNIFNLNQLIELSLTGTLIKEIPNSIKQLSNLEILNLEDCQIKSLPTEIVELKGINSISFTNMPNLDFIDIFKKISLIKNNIGLSIIDCNFSIIPFEITLLNNVEELYLRNNNIVNVPGYLFSLQKLYKLDLIGNKISFIANDSIFSNNIVLKNISLSNNVFTQFPLFLMHLKGLKELDLSYNLISSFPNDIQGLNRSNLNKIDLNNNILEKFPLGLYLLDSLKSIYLRENIIRELPEEIIKFQNLSYIDLSFNKLDSLPSTISKMNQLSINLTGNMFTNDEIMRLKSLFPNNFLQFDSPNLDEFFEYRDRKERYKNNSNKE